MAAALSWLRVVTSVLVVAWMVQLPMDDRHHHHEFQVVVVDTKMNLPHYGVEPNDSLIYETAETYGELEETYGQISVEMEEPCNQNYGELDEAYNQSFWDDDFEGSGVIDAQALVVYENFKELIYEAN